MNISPTTAKLIEIDRQSKQTSADIATAIVAKQHKVAKQTDEAVVQLIQQAVVASPNSTSRGVDIKA